MTGGVTGGSVGTASDLATARCATRSSHDASRIRSGTRSSLRHQRDSARGGPRVFAARSRNRRAPLPSAAERLQGGQGVPALSVRAREPRRGAGVLRDAERRKFHVGNSTLARHSTGHRLCFRRRRRRAPQDVFVVEHDEGSARDVGDGRVDVARLALSLFVPRRRRRRARETALDSLCVRGRIAFRANLGATALEAASIAFSSARLGSRRLLRKFAAHAVLAGRRFAQAGFRAHSARCSASALSVYASPLLVETLPEPSSRAFKKRSRFSRTGARQDAVGARARAPALRAGEADREVRELAGGGGAFREAPGVRGRRLRGGAARCVTCASFCFTPTFSV